MQKYYFGIFLGISCIVLAVVGVQFYHVVVSDRLNVSPNGAVVPGEESATSTDKIKADVFSGALQEVNTGCFADGECYVVVGGKRVTALTGMRINPQPVGTVQGVPGFGDLESYIGSTVEVYAQENADGTYTLYGSEGFYIKLMPVGIGDGSKPPAVAGGCMVGGCSGQLCVDESEGGRVTTCEYAEYYACFQTAKCERQTTGQCGWTDTPELKQCLISKKGTAE